MSSRLCLVLGCSNGALCCLFHDIWLVIVGWGGGWAGDRIPLLQSGLVGPKSVVKCCPGGVGGALLSQVQSHSSCCQRFSLLSVFVG